MPSFEVSDELDGQQEQHHDQEHLDRTVEPGGGRVSWGFVRGDPTVGCADERNRSIGEGSERTRDLLEPQEADPGKLAGTAGPPLLDRSIGARAADLDGDQSTIRILRGMLEKELVALFSLLVPPFLELVVWSSRHKPLLISLRSISPYCV